MLVIYHFTSNDTNKRWGLDPSFTPSLLLKSLSQNERLCISVLVVSILPPAVCRTTHVLSMIFVFVGVYWYPTHIVLCFCFCCLPLVWPTLPVSLDCQLLITPMVFFNVYVLLSSFYCILRLFRECGIFLLFSLLRLLIHLD